TRTATMPPRLGRRRGASEAADWDTSPMQRGQPMSEQKLGEAVPGDRQRSAGGAKASRRTLVKGSAATIGGLLLGTTYVKPGMLSVSVYETAYASGALPVGPPGAGLTG